MQKRTSGMLLILGVAIALAGGALSSHATRAQSTPDTDWWFSMLNGCGMLAIVVGLGMFFFGAMRFSRGS